MATNGSYWFIVVEIMLNSCWNYNPVKGTENRLEEMDKAATQHLGDMACGKVNGSWRLQIQGEVEATSGPRGAKMRRDYILVSEPVFALAQSSTVDLSHETAFAHDDHLPVVLGVSGSVLVTPPSQLWKYNCWGDGWYRWNGWLIWGKLMIDNGWQPKINAAGKCLVIVFF